MVARSRKTTISEQFSYEDFSKSYPEHIVLFLNSDERGLRPAAEGLKKVNPGITIYALILPEKAEPITTKVAPDLSKV